MTKKIKDYTDWEKEEVVYDYWLKKIIDFEKKRL